MTSEELYDVLVKRWPRECFDDVSKERKTPSFDCDSFSVSHYEGKDNPWVMYNYTEFFVGKTLDEVVEKIIAYYTQQINHLKGEADD